ncbi:MAG: GntR family transcriptional regulator [Salinivirgaceae bacterium]|jgi:DNA-binding GntR family transcriptional regulator|nr:GntR family transcriptional regulator [Salinivirgaceae bacterium]
MQKDTKYFELYRSLQNRIIKGEFMLGTLLPSETELKQAYHVTQPTIRHALELLVNDRLIKKHQGKGSIVLPRPVGVGIISFEGRSVTSQNDDLEIQTKIICDPTKVSWPANPPFIPTEKELQLDVYQLERIRTLNNEDVFFEKLWIPNVQLDGFCTLNFNNNSLYEILASLYNITIKSSEQKIWAKAADERISTLLNIELGSPIVRMERRLETNIPNINIYSSLWANTENYLLYCIS